MNILYLGPERPVFFDFLSSFGDKVTVTDDKLKNNSCWQDVDFIISYGYRYIIKKTILDSVQNRAINLHISFLPWNKGADPNLWSFLENTPKGVTIHQIAQGIDTGNIYCQKRINWQADDTLHTTYERLIDEIEELFKKNWSKIRNGTLQPRSQKGEGSKHYLSDKDVYSHLLMKKWETPVETLLGKALLKMEGEID